MGLEPDPNFSNLDPKLDSDHFLRLMKIYAFLRLKLNIVFSNRMSSAPDFYSISLLFLIH